MFTLLVVSLPIWLLYEASVVVVRMTAATRPLGEEYKNEMNNNKYQ